MSNLGIEANLEIRPRSSRQIGSPRFSLRLRQPPSSRFPCLLAVARLCGGCCLLFHPQRFRVLGKRTGGSPLSAVFSRPRSDAHTIRHRMSAICSKNVPNRSEY